MPGAGGRCHVPLCTLTCRQLHTGTCLRQASPMAAQATLQVCWMGGMPPHLKKTPPTHRALHWPGLASFSPVVVAPVAPKALPPARRRAPVACTLCRSHPPALEHEAAHLLLHHDPAVACSGRRGAPRPSPSPPRTSAATVASSPACTTWGPDLRHRRRRRGVPPSRTPPPAHGCLCGTPSRGGRLDLHLKLPCLRRPRWLCRGALVEAGPPLLHAPPHSCRCRRCCCGCSLSCCAPALRACAPLGPACTGAAPVAPLSSGRLYAPPLSAP